MEQLVALVLEHNPELQAARQGWQAAQAAIDTASAWSNPRLEWQRGPLQTLGPPPARQNAQAWAVAQPIDNPWMRQSRIEAAQAQAQSVGKGWDSLRNDLAAQVQRKAYEAYWHQQEALATSEDLKVLEQVRERVQVRVSSGEAARYEIIKADAEIIQAREKLQTTALLAEQNLLELQRMAAGRLPAKWKLSVQWQPQFQPAELPVWQSRTEQHNPEIAALRHELVRHQASLDQEKAAKWPGLELRYAKSREPDQQQSLWGVSIQVPLLDQRRGPIQEAQAQLERARVRLDGRQAELQQQVHMAWQSLEMARLRVEALSQGVLKEAEAALRVAQAAYRFGERGILDVLDAQRLVRSARSDLLQARFQQESARIALEHLSGAFLTESRP